MKTSFAILTLSLFSGPLFAQTSGSCAPDYQVKYNSCVTADSPTEIQRVKSGWIICNEGARDTSDALCIEKVGAVAAKFPQASNIEFAERKNVEAPWRGWGKVDVYGKFWMNTPVKVASESEACGIIDVKGAECAGNHTVDFAKACLAMPMNSDSDLWKRSACMLDAVEVAARTPGMDAATFNDLESQLNIAAKSLARSQSANDRRLSAYIRARQK